jgi:hypothetical protein
MSNPSCNGRVKHLVDGHREHEKRRAHHLHDSVEPPLLHHNPTSKSVAMIDRLSVSMLSSRQVLWHGGCDEYTEDEGYFGVGCTKDAAPGDPRWGHGRTPPGSAAKEAAAAASLISGSSSTNFTKCTVQRFFGTS